MTLNNIHKVGLAIIVFIAVVIGAFFAYQFSIEESHKAKQKQLLDHKFFLFKQPRPISPVMLSNMHGDEKVFSEHLQGWRIVNFGYMFCPDICPINLAFLSDIKTSWDETQAKQPLNVIHVTFDPARDTPEVLKPYLEYMNPAFYGLTGELDNIRRLAQQLHMVFIHEKPDERGHYFISHSDSMALINPKGEYIGMFKAPYQQDSMLKALSLLIDHGA